MNFGDAIKEIKNGQCVQRAGWNGKNMHIYLEDMPIETVGDGVFKGAKRVHDPVVVMFTAQGTHQYGWLASQPDMLADDWQIVANP